MNDIRETNINDFLMIPGGPYVAGISDRETEISHIIRCFYKNEKLWAQFVQHPDLLDIWTA